MLPANAWWQEESFKHKILTVVLDPAFSRAGPPNSSPKSSISSGYYHLSWLIYADINQEMFSARTKWLLGNKLMTMHSQTKIGHKQFYVHKL